MSDRKVMVRRKMCCHGNGAEKYLIRPIFLSGSAFGKPDLTGKRLNAKRQNTFVGICPSGYVLRTGIGSIARSGAGRTRNVSRALQKFGFHGTDFFSDEFWIGCDEHILLTFKRAELHAVSTTDIHVFLAPESPDDFSGFGKN